VREVGEVRGGRWEVVGGGRWEVREERGERGERREVREHTCVRACVCEKRL